MREFSVTFLGTVAASVNPLSPTACCLVEAGGIRIMIDAGFGALRQLRRMPVHPADIDVLLLTHWHFDHFMGLPALLRFNKRKSPLCVYAPKLPLPARLYMGGLLHALHVDFEVVSDGFSKNRDGLCLAAVPTAHGLDSYGWVVAETGSAAPEPRKLVYSGDTRPVLEILHASREADLLIHEATFIDKHPRAASTHAHSTPVEAAALAVEAGVGALALTHIPLRNTTVRSLIEANKIFPGLIVPRLLDKIVVEPAPDDLKCAKPGWACVKLLPASCPPVS